MKSHFTDFDFDLPPPPPLEPSDIQSTLPPPPPKRRTKTENNMPPVPKRSLNGDDTIVRRNEMLFQVSSTPIESPRQSLPQPKQMVPPIPKLGFEEVERKQNNHKTENSDFGLFPGISDKDDIDLSQHNSKNSSKFGPFDTFTEISKDNSQPPNIPMKNSKAHLSNAESSLADFFKPLADLDLQSLDKNSQAPPVFPKVKKRVLPDLPKFSKIDSKIFDYLNQARQQPLTIIPYLEERLTKFEEGTNNLIISTTSRLVTHEGPIAVKEAIEYLKTIEPKQRIEWNNKIGNICKEHVLDIGTSGSYDNKMSDGNYPSKLALERLKGEISQAGESVIFNKNEAKDIILNFIIDDGVSSRGNRNNIFGDWDLFGCYTGEHKVSKSMTTCCYVRNSSTTSSIIQQLLKQVNETVQDPPNWREKKQKVIYTGDTIEVTYTYIMQDGSENIVDVKRKVKDNQIIT